jgi:hypothetical protein
MRSAPKMSDRTAAAVKRVIMLTTDRQFIRSTPWESAMMEKIAVAGSPAKNDHQHHAIRQRHGQFVRRFHTFSARSRASADHGHRPT